MTQNHEEKRKRAERARGFLDQLEQRYPQCFTRDPATVRPLAIGIQKNLRAELAEDEELKETPGWLVRQALAIYVRAPRYLKAIIEQRPRINLDGSTAGEVTEQEKAHAQEQLDAFNARREARRPPKKRPQRNRESAEVRTQRKLEQLAAKFSKD